MGKYAVCAAALWVLLVAMIPVAADVVQVYPTGPLNPRVPVIAAESGTAPQHAAPFNAEFTYALQPSLSFAQGGKLSLLLRDDLARADKPVLRLSGGTTTLTLRISPASKDRALECTVLEANRQLEKTALQRPTDGWAQLSIAWTAKEVTVSQDGKAVGTLALAKPFAPDQLKILTWHVSNVLLEGNGKFALDWSDGYAAHVDLSSAAHGISGRVFGFDTHVISLDPSKRDCPMLQLINADATDADVPVKFSLQAEVNAGVREWTQTIHVPAHAQVWQAVTFPAPMPSDVYHLTVSSKPATIQERVNFLYVPRRAEPAGPPKFGLHDSGIKSFGYWPDALPIDLAHLYASWAVVQGPPWIKDFNGDYGLDPVLGPEQWNWPQKLEWMALDHHQLYVCLQSVPFLDRQRSKAYPVSSMVKYGWGYRGGAPDDAGYRKFLRALIARYRGKIWAYESENEPNTGHGFLAEDYVPIVRAVYEEVKAGDPNAKVFGICGTSTFVDWMQKVFDAGGGQYMDGVSWHTYVTPAMPEDVNLSGLLADARHVMQPVQRPMLVLNSETGTYVAPREQVDQPLSESRLAALISQGIKPLAVPTGWPSCALSERAGAISLITNAVTNFQAGAEFFVFFGWNTEWPTTAKWWNAPFNDSNFGMFSISKEGERTPSQFTLAAAVLTAQLEPADHHAGINIHEYQLRGAIYPKANSGRVAVLWSLLGTQTVLLQSTSEQLEIVSMLGQSRISKGLPDGNGTFLHALDVGEEPIYIHDASPSLSVLPSTVRAATVQSAATGKSHLNVTLRNTLPQAWHSALTLEPDARWDITPPQQPFDLQPGQQAQINFDIQIKPEVAQGRYPIRFHSSLPDGRGYLVSAELPVSSTFAIASLPTGMTLPGMKDWNMPGGPLLLNRPEQVVIGRPPALVSLQEKQFWQGLDELSATVKIGSDALGLSVYCEVRDAHAHLPDKWPGVAGSTVELFFDFRDVVGGGTGLGSSHYDKNVQQLVLRPALKDGQHPAAWLASSGSTPLPGQIVQGGRIDANRYWVAVRILWKDAGITPSAGRAIGFDLGVDGAKEAAGRKCQIMLFGTSSNNQDASHFGVGFLP